MDKRLSESSGSSMLQSSALHRRLCHACLEEVVFGKNSRVGLCRAWPRSSGFNAGFDTGMSAFVIRWQAG